MITIQNAYRAAMALSACACMATGIPAGRGAGEQRVPVMAVEYAEHERHSKVRFSMPGIPGSTSELWCYEAAGLHQAESHHKDGDSLVLIHRHPRGARVVTRFDPEPDGVTIHVEVTGPDVESVRAAGINPCWQFIPSEAFGNRGDYVEDFVARCFVVLEDGLTLLKNTRRVPGTRPRPDDPANLPEPWIQEYYPAWRRHPGQRPGDRGFSLDRPVYPMIGIVSRDEAHLAAIAWPETRRLGQVWMQCLHPRPNIFDSYDQDTGRIISKGRIYFLRHDEQALLDAFHRDFPDWQRPPDLPPLATSP